MKAKGFIGSIWNLRILILFLGILFHYSAYSSNEYINAENSVKIEMDGEWKEGSPRSLAPSIIPFTAFSNGYTLEIQNVTPNCNISIQIIDEMGQAVFEDAVSKDESSYIVIGIDALQDGYYTLEIRNAAGGYVYGTFLKDTNSF